MGSSSDQYQGERGIQSEWQGLKKLFTCIGVSSERVELALPMDAIASRANSDQIRLFIGLLVARWITEWTEGTTKKQAWRRSRNVFF